MEEKLKRVLLLSLSLASKEHSLSPTEKQVFKEFFSVLGLDFNSIPVLENNSAISEEISYLETKEEKILLLDILLLTLLSQGNLENSSRQYLLKVLHMVQLDPVSYVVFPWNITFKEFIKKQNSNLDGLYRMLMFKVKHVLRKKVFIPQWSDALSCFSSAIDRQHKSLVEHFADYIIKLQQGKVRKEIKKMLSFLNTYVQDHFKTEEFLMRRNDFPLQEDHIQAHEEFKQIYNNVLDTFRADKDVDKLQESLASQLAWFLSHIREKDILAGFYIKLTQSSTVRKNQVLIFTSDSKLETDIRTHLESLGFTNIISSDNERESWQSLQTGDIALLLIADRGDLFKGVELLSRVRKNNNDCPTLLIPARSNYNDLMTNIKSQRLSHPRNQILPLPYVIDDLIRNINQALFPSNPSK